MTNTTTLIQLIEQSPQNHALKIALLETYLEQGNHRDFEAALYRFLSMVPQSDPSFEQLRSYLNRRNNSETDTLPPAKKSVPVPHFMDDEDEEDFDEYEDFDDYEEDDEDILEMSDTFTISHEKITFDDVGGLETVKKKIRQLIVNPLKNESLYKVYKKKIGGGLLLYGSPGCGKTYLAKAISHEIEANFIDVSLHEILDMWIGSSEKGLHEVFEKARRNTPCVLFFDEVDALSHSRSKINQSSENKIITQFLREFDGVSSDNDKILIIGATNLPWNIDSAFRRPGRFDKVLFCPPPNFEARKVIFQAHLKDKPVEKDLDLDKLAKLTRDFSGADIMYVINEAADECFEQAMEKNKVVNITEKLLIKMIKSARPSTKEWFSTAQRYLDYSNIDGTYDEIREYLKLKD